MLRVGYWGGEGGGGEGGRRLICQVDLFQYLEPSRSLSYRRRTRTLCVSSSTQTGRTLDSRTLEWE